MKKTLKTIAKLIGIFLICFTVIYLCIFVGLWKLFESGDVILIEIGAAVILSIFVFGISEGVSSLEERIKHLEERIDELEKKEIA